MVSVRKWKKSKSFAVLGVCFPNMFNIYVIVCLLLRTVWQLIYQRAYVLNTYTENISAY